MDGEGNYYHVEKGKGKRYIACNAPKAGEADFASVVEGLRKEAGRRAESIQRERQQNEEEKRRKRLEEKVLDAIEQRVREKNDNVPAEIVRLVEKSVLLQELDALWKDHIATLDYMRHTIVLRAYGQKELYPAQP